MPLTFTTNNQPESKKKQTGHVAPRQPVLDLNGPGRLRSSHILALFGISHSTLYARLKSGNFPQPDGKDGGRNYWNTETARMFLTKPST